MFNTSSDQPFLRLYYNARKLAELVNRDKRLYIVCLSVGLVAVFWILQSQIGLWMGDEGFLFYGSWRVGQGEVPLRDFHSFDPGRYYWVAFWSLCFGYGIIGQRAGVAIFQIIGLVWGLLAARRVVGRHWSLCLAGVLLIVWTWPQSRVFESAFSMGAVLVGTRLIERPISRRLYWTGTFVGIAAFFGRNLGLYSLVAFLSILLILSLQGKIRLIPAMSRLFAGILLGYSPMFVLMLIYPTFLTSFVESLPYFKGRSATNIYLPFPWPWNATLVGQNWIQDAHQISIGVAFVILFVFFTVSVISIIRKPSRVFSKEPLLCAATFVGLTFAHYSIVRSDLSHLASIIHPVLLGVLCLIASFTRTGQNIVAMTVAIALAAVTVFAPLYQQPYFQKLLYRDQFTQETIQGERLWISNAQASYIDAVRSRVEREFGQEDLVFFAPYTPVMYLVLGRKSPVWDIFPLEPAPSEMQHEMIEELERTHTKYAIVNDVPLDGNDAWRFSKTHPEVWTLLHEKYEVIEDKILPGEYLLFRRRQSAVP
jgi:hypothetical protein